LWLGRLFWLSLLLLHGAAIPTLWEEFAGGASIAARLALFVRVTGLALSAAFFILKIVDVPWLRMRGGGRGVVTAVVIVALLHVGVLDRAVADTDFAADPSHLGLILFIGTIWQLDTIRRLIRTFMRLLVPIRLQRRHHRVASCGQRIWAILHAPVDLYLTPFYAGPRAPPAC